jgi:hypothetical protein
MGNWRRTGWLPSQVPEGLAHPLRSGCTARHTQCRSRCRMQAKSQGRRCVFLLCPKSTDLLCARKKKISQVYLHFPSGAGEPPSVLRGFTDVELQPGESTTVNVTLSRYDLSVWDVPSQTWVRAPGTYSLSVGTSSRDFRLKSTLLLY